MKKDGKNKPVDKAKENGFPGYPIYPAGEDIYSRAKEETEIDPEAPGKLKTPVEAAGSLNEKNFKDAVSGSDLDDAQESIGSEDEENNHYSLGGDKES